MSEIKEMGAGGGGATGAFQGNITGVQLPLGAKKRKDEIQECLTEAKDINEAHTLVALRQMNEDQLVEFYDALDFKQYEHAAAMIREQVIREAVRRKLREVVRKKAGGGGYTLYAPNKGKKTAAKPVATFPTKLAAKRAELARFPPKDPKKLRRLRKEIEKLLKDPKKRAEAEKRANLARGTDAPKHHAAGHARGHHFENKILAKAIVETAKRQLSEGLFKEEAPGSAWDEFVKKVSDKSLKGDKGFQRVMGKMDQETQGVFGKALKVVQKEIGASARVKPLGTKKHQDGRSYIAFQLNTEDASVGPIYIYSQNGVPRIEMSDEAKASISKVEPATAKAVRAALMSAQDGLENIGSLKALTGERDAYLQNMETQLDKQIANMSPVQLSMLKQLLVKKYRGSK
jgi:hypothetical protein